MVRARHRQQHGPQALPAGRAERRRRLDDLARHLPDAVRGEPDDRRQRVDQRGDRRRGRADEEEQGERRQVDEGRHRLHEVQHRRDDAGDPVGQPGPQAQRDADDQAQADRGQGEGQGVHALGPQPLQAEQEQPAGGQQADAQVAEGPGQPARYRDDPEPADLRHRPAAGRLRDEPLHGAHDRVDRRADRVEPVQEQRVGAATGADGVRRLVDLRVQRRELRRRQRQRVAALQDGVQQHPAARRRRGRAARARGVGPGRARGPGAAQRWPRQGVPSGATRTARTSSEPTTPSSSPSRTTRTGRSARRTVRAASRTTTSGPSSGPSRASSGRGGRRTQRRVRTSARRHVPHEVADVVVDGRADELVAAAALHDLPVAHDQDAVAEAQRLLQVVGDEHHRLADLAVQPDDLVLHVAADERVERAERLVEEQHLGVAGQRAGQPDALLHAAGQLVGVGRLVARQADELDDLPGPAQPLGPAGAGHLQPVRDVLEHPAVRQQPEVLEDHREAVPAQLAQPLGVGLQHVLALVAAPAPRWARRAGSGSARAWTCPSRTGPSRRTPRRGRRRSPRPGPRRCSRAGRAARAGTARAAPGRPAPARRGARTPSTGRGPTAAAPPAPASRRRPRPVRSRCSCRAHAQRRPRRGAGSRCMGASPRAVRPGAGARCSVA